MITYKEFGASFFACGWIKQPVDPEFEQRLAVLGNNLVRVDAGEHGYFFYSNPFYTDCAENELWILIKLGCVHDELTTLTAREIIERGLVGRGGIDYEQICGSASLVLVNKQSWSISVYRNLLSTFEMKYWSGNGNLVISDNLRLMGLLIPEPALNQAIIPQHFIYRTVYGRPTYLSSVNRLLVGEALRWDGGMPRVELVRDLGGFSSPGDQKEVDEKSVAWFLEVMQRVIGIYLAGNEDTSATLLSGGVDSSLIQTLINRCSRVEKPFPTFSFSVDSPSFNFEVDNANQAAKNLGTKHKFIHLSAQDYRENLVKSIQLLGQPMPDDVRPCFLALTAAIARDREELQVLFQGQIADGLHGIGSSLEVVQGDKYHTWPPGLLAILGKLARPVSQSKSYGASKAADVLATRKVLSSPEQFLNAVGLYTDWDTVKNCFSQEAINQAFTMKRVLGYRYLDTRLMVEQLNVLDLVTDGVDPACLVNQFGLYHGKQYVFPYSDEWLVQASFAFDPIARYTQGHLVKPVLKAALRSQLPVTNYDQPKGWSGIGESTLFSWMQDGELRDLVRGIDRPGFIKQSEFERKLEQPDWFTWNLLTLDLFQKGVLSN
jgi:hypothetical protein